MDYLIVILIILLSFITGIVSQKLNKVREGSEKKYKLPALIAGILIIVLFLIAFSYAKNTLLYN